MTDTQPRYLSSRDVAKLLRRKLRETFPGVKFSVRCDRGTAYGWLQVSWVDGPRDSAVREVCNPWQGRQFNGMTDGYDERGPLLVALEPDTLPVPVSLGVDGINYSRDFSLERLLAAQDVIRKHLPGFDVVVSDAANEYRRLNGPDAGTWFDLPVTLWEMIEHRRGELTGYGLVIGIASTL